MLPTGSNMCTAAMALSSDAPATLPCYLGSISRHKSLMFLSKEESEDLCDRFQGEMMDYRDVKEILSTFGSSLPGLETIQHSYVERDGLQEI
jgi:hypothetical protein